MNIGAIERLGLIRAELDQRGSVRVVELASRLGVTGMTIRRDLDLLVDEGIANRVRGGATAVGPEVFSIRQARHGRAKGRVASKLMELVVADGQTIGIDASSTMHRLATRLGSVRDITVLTNGPDTFRTLTSFPGVRPMLTGGELDRTTGSLVGPLATRSARDLFLDALFIGAAGLDETVGTSESSLQEAEIKLALAENAERVVLGVDSAKLGCRATVGCFDLANVDTLVTELDPADPLLDPYRDLVNIL